LEGKFHYSPHETYPDESLVELLARTAHLNEEAGARD
jgi:hypothetical protein